jgi:protein TonB
MRGDPYKSRFDRRSPVQPDRSPAPYFVAALGVAILIWTGQQYWIQDSNPQTSGGAESTGRLEPGEQPAKGNIRTLFSSDDYPADAQRNGEQGSVRARLDIDKRGRVHGCTVIESSGHASLDLATCRILQNRARFSPARDAKGTSVAVTIVTPPIVWRLEE